jgi:hypothetical protein
VLHELESLHGFVTMTKVRRDLAKYYGVALSRREVLRFMELNNAPAVKLGRTLLVPTAVMTLLVAHHCG